MYRYNNKFYLLLIFVWLFSCTGKSREQVPSQPEEMSILEKIKLKDLNDNPIELSQYHGKTIFINFWATWCKPCIQEMPTIEKVQEQLKNEDVVFLFASNESLDVIIEFKEKRNFDFEYVHVENMEALNIQALPTTFIFNPKSELIFSEAGYRNWNTPENIELLTKKNTP